MRPSGQRRTRGDRLVRSIQRAVHAFEGAQKLLRNQTSKRWPPVRTWQHLFVIIRQAQLRAHQFNRLSHTVWWPWLPTFKAGLAIERVARREAARVPARRGPVCTVGTVGTVSASSSVNVSIVANVMIVVILVTVVILVLVVILVALVILVILVALVILVMVVVFLVVVVIILVSATGG